MRHGTYTEYTRGCLCELCKQAGRDYRARQVVEVHGNSGYAHGCRCEICGAGRLQYQRNKRGTKYPYARQSKYDTPTPSPMIDLWRSRLYGNGS